jgi:tRNA pseudouridine38-40 synthase
LAKWKITLEYDGSGFCGWQSQPNGKGVQNLVEHAISKIDGGHRNVAVAGRTDAGVHALGQVCSVNLEKDWKPYRLLSALNSFFRQDGMTSAIHAELMPDDFDARFSAKGRKYLYIIQNRKPPLSVTKGRAWHVVFDLDLEKMRLAARELIGTHDFTTFRDVQCQAKSPIKTLDVFDITQMQTPFGEQIHCNFEAPSFLHRQVRSMVGSIYDVGRGRWEVADLRAALVACDRDRCGRVAPPDGLYLKAVEY